MKWTSHLQAWGVLGEGCAHNKSCTQNPILKWTTKNWICLLTDWACVFFQLQQSDIGIIPLMPLTWFLTYTLVPGLSKSGHLCIIKLPLHVVLGSIFLVMQRKELTGDRDHNIIWVLDVVPRKFMLTQCSNCRVCCQQAHYLCSASAFL